MRKVTSLAVMAVLLIACTSMDKNDNTGKAVEEHELKEEMGMTDNTGYNFSSPSKVYPMPFALREISGLSVIDNDNVACVQDEEGSVFIFSLAKEEIQRRIPFAGKGDFEELALVGKDAYVLESNGDIYHITDYSAEGTPGVKKLSTQLDKESDAEGLCYDKKNNRLLISCKGKAEEKGKTTKAVYAFDIGSQKLSNGPVFNISLKEIKDALSKTSGDKKSKEMKADEIDQVFTPSGIAIHPLTGEYYVLSSQNNLLAVLDEQGKVSEVHKLKSELFTQPEGIAFASSGELFISNEGQKGMGNILRFEYEKKIITHCAS